MYQSFYHFTDEPFRLTPDPSFVCMTTHHQEALAGLVYSVCTRAGLTVLTGEAGTGKTTLLYTLLDLLEKRRFITAICTNPVLTREELFDFLMEKFAIACDSSSKTRQLSALHQALLRHRQEGRPAVLIVDEAQRLSMELLEEVRLLLNIEEPNEKLLQIILSGQPELEEILRRPELRQFKQRVSGYCRLRPLNVPELTEYIGHRLTLCGAPEQTIFSPAVIEKIHLYSQGIPRLINTLCASSLQVGFATGSPSVTIGAVEEAARDLDLVARIDVESKAPLPPPPASVEEIPVAESKPVNGIGPSFDARDAERIPLASYASRQKSVSFFGGLIDRWR